MEKRTVTLRRVGVVSVGKVFGILYGILGLLAGAGFSLFAVLGAAIGGEEAFGAIFGAFSIIFFPILYGLMGAIFGMIGAALYNLIAGFIGGIEWELV